MVLGREHVELDVDFGMFPIILNLDNFIAMKSISVVDGDAIRKNPLNTSPSKQGYSFSRQQRFRLPPAKSEYFHVAVHLHFTSSIVSSPKGRPVLDTEIDPISPRPLPLVRPAPSTIPKLLCSARRGQKKGRHLGSADK